MEKHLWVIVDEHSLVKCGFDNIPYFYITKRECLEELKLFFDEKCKAVKVYLTRSPKE